MQQTMYFYFKTILFFIFAFASVSADSDSDKSKSAFSSASADNVKNVIGNIPGLHSRIWLKLTQIVALRHFE